MQLCTVVVLLMSVWLTSARFTQLDWSDCGSDPSVTIRNIDVSPMPVVVPGPMQLTVDAQFDRTLSDIEVNLDIKRSTFLLDLPIPCLFHVGSCTYESSCSGVNLLDTMVTEDWAGIMGDIGGQIKTMLATVPGLNSTACPAPATNINIQHYTLNLPEIPSILTFFAEGDYKAHVTASDKATGQTLLCLALQLTIEEKQEPCTGFFCG